MVVIVSASVKLGLLFRLMIDMLVTAVLRVHRELMELQLASSSSHVPYRALGLFSFSLALSSLALRAEMC